MDGSVTSVRRIFVRGPDSGEYAEVGWILDSGITIFSINTTTNITFTFIQLLFYNNNTNQYHYHYH